MIRVVIAGVLVLAGVCTLMVSAAGVFRFSHMLNMIHAAAKCDTTAIAEVKTNPELGVFAAVRT